MGSSRRALIACLFLLSASALAAEYTRDGGTGDWLCCSDKACTTIISQHADAVRAMKACEKLTDADGVTRYTRSNAFRITAAPAPTTGSVSLSWVPPSTNTDGSALTDLAGYRIVYGTSATAMTQMIEAANPTLSAYVVDGLAAGTWYFAVKAYNTAGAESVQSNVASKVIP